MGGKSNRGRNRKGLQNAVNHSEQASAPLSNHSDANGTPAAATEPSNANSEVNELENISSGTTGQGDPSIADDLPKQDESVPKQDESVPKQDESNTADDSKAKQGDAHLFPVTVKTQGGEKLELQLSPGDSVMDVRQFLLDAPETCYFTCYDLLLHTKGGAIHQLEDYNEISEVADITVGDCYLEMVPASYDDRSIRAHVHRTRELLSLSTLQSSLSTSLALQHQTGQNAGDLMKPEVADLENLGFMDNVSGSLPNIFLPPSNEILCVEAIVFSSFNPPPSNRRLSGDLIYLDVATLEGNKYCITGTTKNFYVNSSTGTILDPRPSKSAFEATTIVGLLQKISSKFKKAFREILERKAFSHPFENVQSLLPPKSWLGLYPIPDHKRDAARAEDALTLSFGSELIGMQRDWNEELQSCREFPHSTAQERILRDRALYKVTSDFVDAAINGATGVISRCIPPINPTDPECFHMYVHNNIFFSFAVDADLEQLPKKHASDAPKIESSSTLNSCSERTSNDVPHGSEIAEKADNVEAVNGIVNIVSEVIAETQLAESEQATYASANNDLKGTKAYQEADVPGLYSLAMAIIDYRGHRVVAQSVLPGILQGDKSESLLYGSVDNGKKICWSEGFHTKVSEAAKHLHLKEHSVLDGSGNIFKLAAPVECKGIIGSDDRHYLLDLMRVTPRDANYIGPGSRFCILRPELITAFCHAEAAEKSKSLDKSEGVVSAAPNSSNVHNASAVDGVPETPVPEMQNDEKVETDSLGESGCQLNSKDISNEILFNPNVFTEFQLAGPPEEIAEDEENVRKASTYLKDVILPKFVQDLCSLEVSPMDGHTLTEALHANGINVRYLGKVAEGTRNMPHLWDLCLNEIVVRSAKHILKDILRDSEDHELGNAVAHFLNCLFGVIVIRAATNSTSSRNQKKDHVGHPASWKSLKSQAKSKNKESTRKKQSSFLSISSDSLWSDIQEFAKLKYQFELPKDARLSVKKIPVIRNLAKKVGITVAARRYDLDAIAPFQTSDILNLQPVVKHAIPVSSEAKDLVETGKVQLAEQNLSEAYTLFSEAFTILQQVTGPMHREVANCCRYLAMVLYHAGDMAGAIIQQHKELIINERCLGLDHPDTAHSYGNMALFYHGLNQTDLALRHMSRALLLLSLSSGPDHPDVAATFINVAMMYQDIGKMNTALRYLQEALKKNERLLGEEHIQTAVCYHALAIAFNCMGALKLSLTHETKTYDILVKQLGKEDCRTKDSEHWMNTFKKREEKMTAQKQQGQKAVDMLKAQLIHAGAGTSVSLNKSLTSVAPRGRGVDERAARATEEVRKKAAARGLLTRQPGVPVPAIPHYSPQLAMRNNVVGNNNEEHIDSNEVNGHPPSVADPKPSPEQDERPVGLGAGLKQRTKDKSS